MSAAASQTAGQAAQTAAQAESGGGIFKSIGGAVSDTFKGVGDDISGSYTGIKKGVGDKIKNTPANIANTPIAPGTNIPDIAGQVSTVDTDGLTTSLENVTGLKASTLFPSDAIPSVDNLQGTLEDFLGVLKRQVAAELKHCIEKYLAWLRNKYALADILLDLEGYIQRMIAQYRLKFQRMLRAELEKLFSQKLKMYQIGLLRQKMLGLIRKLCPKIGSKGTHSPTWVRRLQSDPTWQVVDGVTPLYVAAGSSPAVAAAYEDPNNAGQIFENTIDNIMDEIVLDVQSQLQGFNTDVPGGIVIDTTAKPINIENKPAPTKRQTIISLISQLSAQGFHPDEIIERIVEELGEGCRDLITEIVTEVCH